MLKNLLKTIAVLVLLAAVAGALLYKSPQRKQFEAALARAEQGQADAQVQVAQAYLAGEVVKADAARAVGWYQKAAAQGSAPAAYELAQAYLAGEQVERDIPSGVSYLKLAAFKNYAPAQYALGRLYQTGADTVPEHMGQAIWWWLHSAAQGDEDAQAALMQLRTENPAQMQAIEALWQTERKAQAADATAAYELGQAYEQGTLLEKNEEQAFTWYEQAAQQAYAPAQYALYELYLRTDGPVAQDEDKALQYLQTAAEAGLAPAQYTVAERIYSVAQTPAEYQIAQQWFEAAGKQQDAAALYMSGIMYMQGQAGKKNISQAIKNFKQAAELGHADAQYVLGQSYQKGIGVKPSQKQARKWLQLSAQNGNEQADTLLKQLKK